MPHFGANIGFLASDVARAKTHCSYVDRNQEVRFSQMVHTFCTVTPASSGSSNERTVLCWVNRYLNFRPSGRASTVNASKSKLANGITTASDSSLKGDCDHTFMLPQTED
jgi:hypothetical protein